MKTKTIDGLLGCLVGEPLKFHRLSPPETYTLVNARKLQRALLKDLDKEIKNESKVALALVTDSGGKWYSVPVAGVVDKEIERIRAFASIRNENGRFLLRGQCMPFFEQVLVQLTKALLSSQNHSSVRMNNGRLGELSLFSKKEDKCQAK